MSEELEAAPLEGVVVLDMTRWMAGPYAAMLLADAGATVIKVEPKGGESNRRMNPRLTDADGSEVSGYFLRLNRRKRSVEIDLKSSEGNARFRDLVREADVVLENFRPGVLAKMGYSWEQLHELNPRLVYCAISGFGATAGPYSDWPAFNLVAEAFGGLVHWDSHQAPAPLGAAIGDMFPASQAVSGIVMALLRRGITGKGSFVDIAMYDSVVSLNEMAVTWAEMTGTDFQGYGNQNLAPYDFYPAQDGYVCVGVATDVQWRALCAILGKQELGADPRFATGGQRVANAKAIEPILVAWLSTRSKKEAASTLATAGVPAAPVQSGLDIIDDPHLALRDMFENVSTVAGGSWRIPASPIRFRPDYLKAPATVPRLGEFDDPTPVATRAASQLTHERLNH